MHGPCALIIVASDLDDRLLSFRNTIQAEVVAAQTAFHGFTQSALKKSLLCGLRSKTLDLCASIELFVSRHALCCIPVSSTNTSIP